MGDKVDAAIAAAEGSTAPRAPVGVSVTLSSGRAVSVLVPADLTVKEALDLVSFVSSGLGAELERRRGPRLAIARQLPSA